MKWVNIILFILALPCVVLLLESAIDWCIGFED